MAQNIYSIDLQGAVFPMLSEQQGRTIIGGTVGESPSKENKPGIAYCHNVMPNEYGFESVGFKEVVGQLFIPPELTIVGTRIVYGDTNRTRVVLGFLSDGSVVTLRPSAFGWQFIGAPIIIGPLPRTMDGITVSNVDGKSYITVSTGTTSETYVFLEDFNFLSRNFLLGLDESTVIGTIGSSGYLLAYTETSIAWSSTINPTDFVPSSVTGAGGANVTGIAGKILFGTSNSLGILLYTNTNVVAGTYTGNPKFPFKFREVASSKGGINLDRIAYEANSVAQFVYTTAGLQSVTSQKAENILPYVTDFLAGRRFEDYNEITKEYEVTNLASEDTMLKKIRYIASRYLVISYGLTSFTHALIFDTSLNKLGKIKRDHVDVFEFVGEQTEISKETLAFLSSNAAVNVVDFSSESVGSGVIVLGKLQASRTRFLNLLGIEVENVDTTSTLNVSSQASLDGKTFITIDAVLKDSATNIREYTIRSEAMNHSLAFTGKFNLVTVQIRYTTGGRR